MTQARSPAYQFASALLFGADAMVPPAVPARERGWWRNFLTALAGRAGMVGDAAARPDAAVRDSEAGVATHGAESASPARFGPAKDVAEEPESWQKEADELDRSLPGQLVGFRGPTACQVVGITYRELDHWACTGLVVPSIREASKVRLYSFKDVLILKVAKRLLDAGVSLQNIRVAVEHMRRHGIRDLTEVTLFSDGETVHELPSPEEVVALLQGGQGVFGIAVSGAMREISRLIKEFPGERAIDDAVDDFPEKTSRRHASPPCARPDVTHLPAAHEAVKTARRGRLVAVAGECVGGCESRGHRPSVAGRPAARGAGRNSVYLRGAPARAARQVRSGRDRLADPGVGQLRLVRRLARSHQTHHSTSTPCLTTALKAFKEDERSLALARHDRGDAGPTPHHRVLQSDRGTA